MVAVKPNRTIDMSKDELRAYLGSNAHRWTYAFVERYIVTKREDESWWYTPDPVGLMWSWFTEAIEAGRDAGRAEHARKTTP